MRFLLFVTAAVLYGQTAPDPADVLARTRARVMTAMKRLPKYACVQTINRSFYAAPSPAHGEASCTQLSADSKNRQKPARVEKADRLRLDVAQADGREIHSWPGASRFDMTEIDQTVDSGPFGTGSFGGYLVIIFDNDGTEYHYQGERTEGSSHVFVYGYSVAKEASHYEMKAVSRPLGSASGNPWITTAFSGTFEVDAASLEIRRLTVDTPELPAETGLCEAHTTLDYHRVQIGDGSFLLPQQGQLHLIDRDGMETDNTTTFSTCREYQAKSVVVFGPRPSAPGAGSQAAQEPRPPLPGGIELALKLTALIDTDTAAAGDRIEATVVKPVRPMLAKAVIPAGAVVHGRISRLGHYFLPFPYWAIGISLQSLEIDGQSSPLAASLEQTASIHLESAGTPFFDSPDSLVFQGGKRHVIPAGTVYLFVTLPPQAAKN